MPSARAAIASRPPSGAPTTSTRTAAGSPRRARSSAGHPVVEAPTRGRATAAAWAVPGQLPSATRGPSPSGPPHPPPISPRASRPSHPLPVGGPQRLPNRAPTPTRFAPVPRRGTSRSLYRGSRAPCGSSRRAALPVRPPAPHRYPGDNRRVTCPGTRAAPGNERVSMICASAPRRGSARAWYGCRDERPARLCHLGIGLRRPTYPTSSAPTPPPPSAPATTRSRSTPELPPPRTASTISTGRCRRPRPSRTGFRWSRPTPGW